MDLKSWISAVQAFHLKPTNVTNVVEKKDCYFLVLPYRGKSSLDAKSNILSILNDQPFTTRVILKSTKINDLVRAPDKKPPLVNSGKSVYKFSCPQCSATYVGYSNRHLCYRIDEHISFESGPIYKHLLSHNISPSFSLINHHFSIVSKRKSKFDLLVTEAIAISRIKPTLNTQIDSLNFSCLIDTLFAYVLIDSIL